MLGACSHGDAGQMAEGGMPPNVVTFTALDYKFEGPAEIPAGLTTFRLVSTGEQIHHMTLMKLADGKTIDSVNAFLRSPAGPLPEWMVMVGGPNAPAPGSESNATLELEPGNYIVVCFVDTPDRVPHVAKGMVSPLTVTPSPNAGKGKATESTITVTMNEYAFALDKPLTAGKHTILVNNTGKEPHELSIIRMDPGKTLEDLGAWMQSMQGPPPGAPLGGASPIAAGKTMQFDVDVQTGSYLLICFLPDSTGARLHFQNGMVQTFEVQ
jgi:uncharacterized cupredoxin-like copper-binding protein